MNQHNLILDLIANNPNKYRFSCPECGRQNSLAIYDTDGSLSYHCYGATCKLHGSIKQRLTLDEIFNRRNIQSSDSSNSNVHFCVPVHFTSGLSRKAVRDYLQSVHCLSAAIDGRVQIRYDPREDRCVFLIYDDQKNLVNATGRALTKGAQPKWRIYGTQRYPLVCGNSTLAVIVEDAPSAVRISYWATGIAVLGTDTAQSFTGELRRYKRVIIALDKDAQRKALQMEASLRYFADVSIAFLEEDLKNLDDAHCKEFLGQYIDFDEVEDL